MTCLLWQASCPIIHISRNISEYLGISRDVWIIGQTAYHTRIQQACYSINNPDILEYPLDIRDVEQSICCTCLGQAICQLIAIFQDISQIFLDTGYTLQTIFCICWLNSFSSLEAKVFTETYKTYSNASIYSDTSDRPVKSQAVYS